MEDWWIDIWYDSVWNNITSIDRLVKEILAFKTQKPKKLLKRILQDSSNHDSTILDFFPGSGTTIDTAHKLGRKWIGLEMGEPFYNVIIPRLKVIIAVAGNREPCGMSKDDDANWTGGRMFKYYELESYEDILSKMACEDELNDGMYIFDKKYSEVVEIDEEKELLRINLDNLYSSSFHSCTSQLISRLVQL